MTNALVHRGPDEEGFLQDPGGRVAFGMRRLAIIDLAGGQQPMFNEDRSIACVLNGEIYNHIELRRGLEAKGHRFASLSDTEVLVHLYEEEGIGCLGRLRGMFAFAVWDALSRTVFLARDRVGKKPLYYADYEGRLSFASEVSALATVPGLPRDVDVAALDVYLTHSYIPAPLSIFQAVRKLPAGHFMTVREGGCRVERYWSLNHLPAFEADPAELTEQLRHEMLTAVRLRLLSDVPLGVCLSGGVDSSSVVAMTSQLTAKPVKTFSIGFSEAAFSELDHARIVADRFQTDHHEFVVKADAAEALPQIVRHFGEPFGDSSALPSWYLAKMVRSHVTVALNGDGGDELFAGYTWYRSAIILDRVARLTPKVFGRLLAQLPTARRGSLQARLSRLGTRLVLPPGPRFASLRSFLDPGLKAGLYSERLLSARADRLESTYLADHYAQTGGDNLWRLQETDINTYLPEDLLVKVDRMTMAHSVEGRSPLLDHELLEFCARIPVQLRMHGDSGKVLLREAMRPLFPPGFLDRRKMGFSVPLAEWLKGELRELCYQKICGASLSRTDWFRPAALRSMLDEHVRGEYDWSSQIWNLLVLAEWTETCSL
jgi:asparagine synthase (glutamine-hydrolysing)